MSSFLEISSFQQSRNKLSMFNLFPLCRKDELSFDMVAKTATKSNVASTFCENGNNVEAAMEYRDTCLLSQDCMVQDVVFHVSILVLSRHLYDVSSCLCLELSYLSFYLAYIFNVSDSLHLSSYSFIIVLTYAAYCTLLLLSLYYVLIYSAAKLPVCLQ